MESSSLLGYVYLVPDIDECSPENNCQVNATCTNTVGSYNCTCQKGYGGDGGGCPGKGQFKEGIIATDADSFVLRALRGHYSHDVFAHTGLVVVAMLLCLKLQSSSTFPYVHFVPDIDECSSENDCHVNATCTNTLGSYNCTCNKGYEGDGRNCSGKLQSYHGNVATNADSFFFFLQGLRAY